MNPDSPRAHDDEHPEDAAEEVGAYGRVWMRWNPSQGSSQLALKAMAALYDAGQPLSGDELTARLYPQLDTYTRSYLEAWWLRKQDQQRKAKPRKSSVGRDGIVVGSPTTIPVNPREPLRRWLSDVFSQRARSGQTLIRDPDGRYRPGPQPPRAQRIDGRIVKFTPEQRQEMAQQERDDRITGWQAAMTMEWQRIRPQLEALTKDHSRLVILTFLARRFSGSMKTNTQRVHVSETVLRSICHHLLNAENPAVQQAILTEVLAWAYTGVTPHE